MRITAGAIAKAQPGDVLTDHSIPGLQVRCGARSKAFYLYYRTKDGRQRRPKLGSTNVLSVEQARAVAKELLVSVAAGEDPVAKRREAKTVDELADRYLSEHATNKKSKASDYNLVQRYVRPKLGRLPVKSVQYDDIAALHKTLDRAPYQANRVLSLLSKMFNLAERWGLRANGSNPCRHVARFPERKRLRYVREEEAPKLASTLAKFEASHPEAVAFLWTLAYTGARPGEVLRFTWEDIKDGKVVLHEHKTDQQGGSRTIYLPQFLMERLNTLPKTQERVFNLAKPPRKLWERIREEAGCPDLRMYDLRHTFASAALAAGYSLGQIGELLGHTDPQTTMRYAHLTDTLRREATEATAEMLKALALRPGSPIN